MFNSPWIRKPEFKNAGLDYDSYWKSRGWTINPKLKSREKIMYSLIPEGSSVADVGCGNSRLPVELKGKKVRVTVADISEKVLKGYEAFGVSSTKIDLEKVNEIKFAGHFDYMILSEVLEHVRNPEEIINALKKYTDRFIITIPNTASYQFRYGLMFRGRFFTQWVYHPSEHLRFWSHTDFLDWLKAMGLEVEQAIPSEGFTLRGLLPWIPRLWKNLLAYRLVYVAKVPSSNKPN
jgi:methionine biosynthesis protein MetW